MWTMIELPRNSICSKRTICGLEKIFGAFFDLKIEVLRQMARCQPQTANPGKLWPWGFPSDPNTPWFTGIVVISAILWCYGSTFLAHILKWSVKAGYPCSRTDSLLLSSVRSLQKNSLPGLFCAELDGPVPRKRV